MPIRTFRTTRDDRDKNLELLEYPLWILQNIGLYSNTNKRKVSIVAAVYLIPLTFLIFMNLVQFLFVNGDLLKFVYNLEELGAFTNDGGKLVVFVYLQGKFSVLLEHSKHFWKTTNCPEDLRNELNKILTFVARFQYTFTCCIAGSVFLIFLGLLLGRKLPTGAWNLEGYDDLYKIVLFTQIITIIILCTFLVGFGSIFIALCARLIVQFKILKYCFKQNLVIAYDCSEAEASYKMRTYIEHHIFLLRFLALLRDFYSPIMLAEYLSVTPIICTEMYVIFESQQFSAVPRLLMVMLSVFIDFAFYCIPADYVTDEAAEVATAVYNSDWQLHYLPTLRKRVPLIIHMCQKEFMFTAGGLFDMNSKTLLTILRVSWSICTVMRALKQK